MGGILGLGMIGALSRHRVGNRRSPLCRESSPFDRASAIDAGADATHAVRPAESIARLR
jgi:hypothetical protein